MNQTTNYELSQWEGDDRILREDFNSDNEKIDAALKTNAEAITSEAGTRASAISTLTTQLAAKGNCQIYYTTYVGDGTGGEDAPCSITFPHKPLLVFIGEEDGVNMFAVADCPQSYRRGTNSVVLYLIWSGKTFMWYHPYGGASQMNSKNSTYHLVALLDTDN